MCGLDPDHDSGLFVYHLSQLIDSGIIKRRGEGYGLTNFGEKASELLLAVERESSFLLERIHREEKEVKEVKEDIDVQWVGPDEMVQRGVLYRTEEDFVPKMSHEQRQIYETAKKWPKSDRYLVASKEEKPLAHLRPELKYRITAECEKFPRPVKVVKAVEPQLEIEDIGLRTTEAVDRKNAVIALLEALEDESRNIGVKRIQVYKVNADDEAVVSALKERGFQRFATTYVMTKNL
ncbi:MAG: hypothetical protein ACETV1_06265 [Candidatus Bathyarchaeia archaeon]